MVVRLAGTNEKEGRQIIDDADIPNMITAATLAEAAQQAVEAAKNAQGKR
jgi:succinyl-CoA synthetase beta subunit